MDKPKDKFIELLLYVLSQRDCTFPDLMHILFQADMQAYGELGRSVTGANWIKGSRVPRTNMEIVFLTLLMFPLTAIFLLFGVLFKWVIEDLINPESPLRKRIRS